MNNIECDFYVEPLPHNYVFSCRV